MLECEPDYSTTDLQFDMLKSFDYPHCRAHCADSVVVITRRCQRLNPGSSPGRRIPFLHTLFPVRERIYGIKKRFFLVEISLWLPCFLIPNIFVFFISRTLLTSRENYDSICTIWEILCRLEIFRPTPNLWRRCPAKITGISRRFFFICAAGAGKQKWSREKQNSIYRDKKCSVGKKNLISSSLPPSLLLPLGSTSYRKGLYSVLIWQLINILVAMAI